MMSNETEVSKIRVLVVDDEETITEFLSIGLAYEGYEVAIAADGGEALQVAQAARAAKQPFDLAVLDVMLPGMDGLELCRRLRATSDLGIIMLTARGESDDSIRGLDAGADDYLPKPFKFKELLARIRAVLRRRGVNMAQTLSFADLSLNRTTREVQRGSQRVDLTPREFELLELMLAHPRQVFSRETIMNRVWGYDYLGDTNVIDVHIRYLREKIGDRDHRLIQTVRGVGYVLREG